LDERMMSLPPTATQTDEPVHETALRVGVDAGTVTYWKDAPELLDVATAPLALLSAPTTTHAAAVPHDTALNPPDAFVEPPGWRVAPWDALLIVVGVVLDCAELEALLVNATAAPTEQPRVTITRAARTPVLARRRPAWASAGGLRTGGRTRALRNLWLIDSSCSFSHCHHPLLGH
jgi:hypothetical protein